MNSSLHPMPEKSVFDSTMVSYNQDLHFWNLGTVHDPVPTVLDRIKRTYKTVLPLQILHQWSVRLSSIAASLPYTAFLLLLFKVAQ